MSHQPLTINKVILHIDFDSYFASCEQQFNPLLRGKPIGVTAQNGRTCIIAASREAKKLGVKFDFYHLKQTPSFQIFMTENIWDYPKAFKTCLKNGIRWQNETLNHFIVFGIFNLKYFCLCNSHACPYADRGNCDVLLE